MQPSDTHQMESTQPRHLTEGSTVSLDQLSNRPGMMMPTTRRGTRLRPPPALNPSATALLRVLRYRWLLALGLGLAAAAIVAALTWFVVPRPKDAYEARALLIASQSAPRVLATSRDPVDFGTYRRTQVQLATSLSVAKRALMREDVAKMLADNKQDPDKVAREVAKSIKVDAAGQQQEWPSQILPLTLTWPTADEAVAIVNAVAQELVDEASQSEQVENRMRYKIVNENYIESQKGVESLRTNLHNYLNDLAVLTTDEEQQLRDEIRLMQSGLSQEEIAIMKGKQSEEYEKLMNNRQKAPPLVVTDQLVEDYVKKDAEIRFFIVEQGRTREYMAKLRIIATNPESLPEYQEYQTILDELNKKIAQRTAEIRPTIRKRLNDIANKKAEPEEDEGERIRITLAEKNAEQVRARLKAKAAELSRLAGSRGKAEINLRDKIDNTKTELDQRTNLAKRLLDEREALKNELGGNLTRLKIEQPATEAEKVISKDPNNAVRTVGLAAIGAFCLAALGVGWWEFRSRRIHTTDELAGQLGLRMIGTVPSLPEGVRRQPIPIQGQEMYWHSRLTEAVDSITTLLLHEASQVGARALLVTSAVGHEGKTTLACHLATSLARAGKRTLLIDGDLVHPTAHLMFNEGLEPGLSDLLRGQCNVPDVVRPTQASGLWMITAGQADSSVVQALARDAMQPLLEMLKSEYDFIVIDSSPVLPLAHALLIGKHVDAAVLAVRRDISRVMPVYAAYQRLATLGIPVLGAVFMEQNNPGYDSYTYSEGSIPGQNMPPVPPAMV